MIAKKSTFENFVGHDRFVLQETIYDMFKFY